MPYIVYVTYPTSIATVHNVSCQRHQERKAPATANGYWSEPQPSFRAAWGVAEAAGQKLVRACKLCCRRESLRPTGRRGTGTQETRRGQ